MFLGVLQLQTLNCLHLADTLVGDVFNASAFVGRCVHRQSHIEVATILFYAVAHGGLGVAVCETLAGDCVQQSVPFFHILYAERRRPR